MTSLQAFNVIGGVQDGVSSRPPSVVRKPPASPRLVSLFSSMYSTRFVKAKPTILEDLFGG